MAEEIEQVEDDAKTVQRMSEIMGDPKRHVRAQKKVNEMISNMENSKKFMGAMKNAKMDYSKSKMPEKK